MQTHFDAEEAKRRLAHLASLPETTSRRLEMAALRRTLEMAATQPSTTRGRRIRKSIRISEGPDVPDTPEKPSREVSRTFNGTKKIILRKKSPEKKPLTDDDRDDRERMKRIKDFGTNLNQGF